MQAAHIHRAGQTVFKALNPLVFAAALACASSSGPAHAITYTWFGGTGDWSLAGNWTPGGGPPSFSDLAVINLGAASLSSGASMSGLTMGGGQLVGTGTLTVSGAATWSGGSMNDAGTTQFNGPLSISGSGTKDIINARTINLAGTTTWGGNTAVNENTIRFAVFGGGAINNSGTWLDQNAFDTRIATRDGFLGSFNNLAAGTYVKSGAGVTSIDNAFNNTGQVMIKAGTLNLDGGGTSSGSFNVASGTILSIGGTNRIHTLNAPTFSGTGLLQINASDNGPGSTNVILNGTSSHAGPLAVAGNLGVNGSFTVPVYTQTAGALNGTGTLTVSGAATWSGGSMNDAGTTQFNGPLSISGSGPKDIINTRVINVAGTTTWGGNTAANENLIRFAVFGGGAINNSGTWRDQNAFDTRIATRDGFLGSFNNLAAGTYVKSGAGVTSIDNSFNNTGQVMVKAGALQVSKPFDNQGVIDIAAGAQFQTTDAAFTNAGTIQGKGTVQTALNQALTNNGVIAPGNSIGRLTVDGDLKAGAAGSLKFELTGLASFDQLAITDDVTLGGDIGVWDFGYTPVVGDSFVVMTFDQRLTTSTFDSLTLHGFAPGTTFDVIYGDHDVTLKVLTAAAAVPEPGNWLLMLAGIGTLGSVVRRRRTG